MSKINETRVDGGDLIKKIKEDEGKIAFMLEGLESVEKLVSVIYSEKNEERAIFCLLLLLTTKLNLGYVESYYFTYDSKKEVLKYKEGYFDLRKISDSQLEEIYNRAQEKIELERVPYLKDILERDKAKYSIKELEYQTPYEFLNKLKNYAIIPICYGKKKYGVIFLSGNKKFIRFERKEKEIVDLFKYNLSMYLYNRKLEAKELQTEKLRTIGHFANSIVHEFKTPVSVIKGLATLAKGKMGEPEKVEEYLDKIITEANRIVDMSQEVSDYADLRDRNLDKINYKIMSTIRREVESHREELDIKKITPIYLGSEEAEDYGNPEKLRRVIGYLIKNVIENVDYNKESRYILIKFDEDIERLTIEDNGIGINKKNLGEVFNPFYSTKINGTGLGLTIVREGLERAGYNVRIESQEGQFTKVIIER